MTDPSSKDLYVTQRILRNHYCLGPTQWGVPIITTLQSSVFWYRLFIQQLFTTFTNTEVNNCFRIYLTETKE